MFVLITLQFLLPHEYVLYLRNSLILLLSYIIKLQIHATQDVLQKYENVITEKKKYNFAASQKTKRCRNFSN